MDFNDPNLTRTPRQSAHFYANVVKSHSLTIPDKYTNSEHYMWYSFIIFLILLVVIQCVYIMKGRVKKKENKSDPLIANVIRRG